MRNPVRPPVGFFNRRLSTRQNSSVDKVSASCTFTFHFHFHYLAFPTLSPFFLLLKSFEMRNKSADRFPFSIFAFAFLLGPRHSLSLTEPANAEQKREYFHFSLSLSLSHFPFSNLLFSVCLHTEPANAEQKREYNRRGVSHWVRRWKRRGDLACFGSFHTYFLKFLRDIFWIKPIFIINNRSIHSNNSRHLTRAQILLPLWSLNLRFETWGRFQTNLTWNNFCLS